MFAAFAIGAQMILDVGIVAAQWIATRLFVLAILAVGLPWVLKGALSWAFDWMIKYCSELTSLIMQYISSATGTSLVFNINITGVGGYIASQVGLADYASIIFTGWGLYWMIAVLAKTPRAL